MKFKSVFVILIVAISFSGCNALLKERKAARYGVERNDFELPIFLYPSSNPQSKNIVFLLSGDSGWIEFEDSLATTFSKAGFNVVGFNSRSYFWEQKTPQQTATDLILLINKYTEQYKSTRIYLSGYSFGADVVPFVYNLLPANIKGKVIALQMLSPFASSDFDVHIINLGEDNYPYSVKDEIKKVKIPIHCFYGEEEEPKALFDVKQKNFSLKTIPGDHHYETAGYQQIVSSLRRRSILVPVIRLRPPQLNAGSQK